MISFFLSPSPLGHQVPKFWNGQVSMPRKMSRYFSAAGIIPPQEGNRASGEDPEETVKREDTSAAGGRLRLLYPSPLSPWTCLMAPCCPLHSSPYSRPRGCSSDALPGQNTAGKRPFPNNFRHRARAGDPMQESRHQPRLMPGDAILTNPASVL